MQFKLLEEFELFKMRACMENRLSNALFLAKLRPACECALRDKDNGDKVINCRLEKNGTYIH